MINDSQKAFLTLVKAGLWEKEAKLLRFGKIDFAAISVMADAQGVTGLLAVGLEHADVKPSLDRVMSIVGKAMKIERQNKAQNLFVEETVKKMREAGINILLVKGQGVAQCYERPLWRASGDVDFLLGPDHYKKAIEFLQPLSSSNKPEERYSRHLGMKIGELLVEVHGSLRTGLSARVDREVDAVQKDVLYGGKVRSWNNGSVQVLLPAPNEDVFLVFTHFIKHFYKGGMSLRQVCDWCRLLWTYRSDIKTDWLGQHLRKAGLMKEWRTFAALAVDFLGMPAEAMPIYDSRFKVKDSQLMELVLRGCSGNKIRDTWRIAKIFPWKALHYSPSIFLNVNLMKVKERLFIC